MGFLLQKLAHRDAEMLQMDGADKESLARGICSSKWLLGFMFITLNPICQSLVLPFVDLSLLSCNAATAIIVNVLLSTKVLGETFLWKYDFTAMVLIAVGTAMIVLRTHTEPVDFTGDQIRDVIFSMRNGLFILLCVVLFILDKVALSISL